MKNDILKISGVSFSKFSYFWAAVWAFGGFRGNFEHFHEHMPKESPRGCIEDHFGYSSKSNIEVTKMIKMMIFQISTLSPYLRLGSLRDHQKAFLGSKNDS